MKINELVLKDRLMIQDVQQGFGFWRATQIIGGYGIHEGPFAGLSELSESIFESHNTVTIGGVQYAMEQIFGETGPVSVPTLYDELGVGLPNAVYQDVVVPDPDGDHNMPYHYGNRVVLFGIGLTGSAENNITKYPVNYRERGIQGTRVAEDGTELDGIMIPFRYTSQDLTENEQRKYFGKKKSNDYTAYYLKRFENPALVRHLWSVGSADDGDIEVTNAEVWTSTRTTAVQSIAEMQLKITNKDIKEFFNITGRIDDPRFNTVALFSADYNQALGDYENVKMFSKLYIPTENVSLAKDLDLIYRVYGS